MDKFTKRIISKSFMSDITDETLRNEVLCTINDTYQKRTRQGINQVDYAKMKGMSPATLKRIELGKCYNLRSINQYIK